MLYFNLVGTLADIDETTAENPLHPAPVLLIEIDDEIERVVLPATAWSSPRDVLQVGRRVRVGGHFNVIPKRGSLPVAFCVELIAVH